MVLTLSAALIGGLGCATAIVGSGPNTKTKIIEGAVVLTDDILAFGRPDETMAKAMGKAHAIAFLGKANTYLLVEGGETLLSLTPLDPARLTLTPDNHRLHIQDKTIWGTLEFTYSTGKTPLSDTETAALKSLKFFRKTPDTLSLNVSIKGAVYPAISLQGTGFTEMQRARKLSFHAPSTTETKPDLSKIALLPVALVVDVITAPLQLLGAGVLLLSMGR
ncbi:hypothetical protein B9Z51_01840 [Limnohabitans sp. T6-5]|nr:hypothetical protein B9Z51_01840 [Limnohabitans sp. T6-5]